MNAGTVVLGYARVSTAEQAGDGYGLDAQEAAIREECERRGWALLEVVREEGASAKSLDRPALRHALERIAAGEASGLIAAKLDRLSRSVVDFGVLLEWFEEAVRRSLRLTSGSILRPLEAVWLPTFSPPSPSGSAT